MRRFILLATMTFVVSSSAILSPALAHTGNGTSAGFTAGFLHPVSGIGHVLAMVAVGIFAAHLGGRALRLVPVTFVTMMAVAGAPGMTGAGILAGVL